MASAAGGPGSWARRAAFKASPRVLVRGTNLLAELDALCILGAGRFEVGVNYALNVFRAVPIADASGVAIESPFAGREDKRQWGWRIYEEDAYLLARMGSSTSLALSHVLGVAWPHVHSGYRERFDAHLADMPDDGMARAWRAAGGPPWWRPSIVSGTQTHLVVDDPDALSHTGVPR